MLNLTHHLSLTFLANYSEFPNGCRSLQFHLGIYVGDVLIDVRHILIKQVGHLLLRQPDGLSLQPNLGRNRTVGGRVNNNGALQAAFGLRGHGFPFPSFFLADGK
jgi:hypothetical protein